MFDLGGPTIFTVEQPSEGLRERPFDITYFVLEPISKAVITWLELSRIVFTLRTT